MNTNPVIPTVSLILVARNEINWIEKSLDSLLKQDYPLDKIELLIIDGQSDDGTREFLVEKIAELKNLNYCVKFYDNPQKTLSSGWNIAIAEASGDIVCRIDCHSTISEKYISSGVNELLKRKLMNERIAGVGGWLTHCGNGYFGEIIAGVYSSPFGAGNSPFRIKPKKVILSDTAVYALYWKEIFKKVGFFDENLKRNQDIALHQKMIAKGYIFITHPDMSAEYYVNNSIYHFIKKAFNNGKWIILSGYSYYRHRVPLLFIAYLIAYSTILVLNFNLLINLFLALPLIIYLILSFYFASKKKKAFSIPVIIFLYFIYHVSYGFGSLSGIMLKSIRKFGKKTY